MERQKKVVDASVIVKCFVNEPGSDAALELWEEHTSGKSLIVVPDTALSEILNVLRYKHFDNAKLQAANKIIWDAQLHTERTSQFLMGRAAMLALKHNLSVYDAFYLAVGELFGAQVYTSDKQLSRCPNTISVPA